MLDGDAAGEVHRRGRICSKRLSYVGFFGAPFLPKQERCSSSINSNLYVSYHRNLAMKREKNPGPVFIPARVPYYTLLVSFAAQESPLG